MAGLGEINPGTFLKEREKKSMHFEGMRIYTFTSTEIALKLIRVLMRCTCRIQNSLIHIRINHISIKQKKQFQQIFNLLVYEQNETLPTPTSCRSSEQLQPVRNNHPKHGFLPSCSHLTLFLPFGEWRSGTHSSLFNQSVAEEMFKVSLFELSFIFFWSPG